MHRCWTKRRPQLKRWRFVRLQPGALTPVAGKHFLSPIIVILKQLPLFKHARIHSGSRLKLAIIRDSNSTAPNSAPTLPSGIHNALECPWDSADHTRLTSPRAIDTSATCPADSWGYRMTLKVAPHIDLHCKHGSSTSAATKPQATFARQRSFS